MPLREVKDAGEIELLKKASTASIAAQREMMKSVKPGVTERTIAGKMTAVWYEQGCERPSYAPIVGTGINSTTLHYSANSATIADGDVVVVDAACEYSMYASDITRTVPANGHFTARQREIYNVVLGAQKAAIDAFVAGKSKINDYYHRDPDSLDAVAYNYINTHGKDLHGQPLGKYWLHGLGHMVGIDVHDPAQYPRRAQARHGLHHRARRLHPRRENRCAHRMRFPRAARRQAYRPRRRPAAHRRRSRSRNAGSRGRKPVQRMDPRDAMEPGSTRRIEPRLLRPASGLPRRVRARPPRALLRCCD